MHSRQNKKPAGLSQRSPPQTTPHSNTRRFFSTHGGFTAAAAVASQPPLLAPPPSLPHAPRYGVYHTAQTQTTGVEGLHRLLADALGLRAIAGLLHLRVGEERSCAAVVAVACATLHHSRQSTSHSHHHHAPKPPAKPPAQGQYHGTSNVLIHRGDQEGVVPRASRQSVWMCTCGRVSCVNHSQRFMHCSDASFAFY